MSTSRTGIEWTDRTWNPVTGCSKVSPGCKNCYAETVAKRFWKGRKFTDVQCHPERLDQPLRWRKPSRIFVNSMSDLFHEDIPRVFLERCFTTMGLAKQHTFQVLTKRPERARDFCARWFANREPYPNVHLGVSVENQETADARIPILLQTPASVRFLSVEPLLEAVDLSSFLFRCPECGDAPHFDGSSRWRWSDRPQHHHGYPVGHVDANVKTLIDWVIMGGESGPGARPCNVEWLRGIVRQCKAASVPVFVKQLGSHPHESRNGREFCMRSSGWCEGFDWNINFTLHDRKGGDISEWPEDLRIREFPA